MNRETPRNKDDKAQEHDKGIRERSGGCSSRRVPVQLTESAGWWMGDDDSHGVEITIAGGVGEVVREGEVVRGPTPKRCFFLFFLFLYHVFIVTLQELACSASYGVNKTSISKHIITKEKPSPFISKCVKYSTHHQTYG